MADETPEPTETDPAPIDDTEAGSHTEVSSDAPADTSDEAEASDAPAEVDGATKAGGKAGAKAGAAKPPVVRKKVVSKRVTPKGGPVPTKKAGSPARGGKGKGATRGSTAAHAHSPEGHDAEYSSRYTPPTAKYADGPSPWWVPAIMFGCLVIGALIIILNYMGAFGDAENIRLVIGLGFILAGIIAATQYR